MLELTALTAGVHTLEVRAYDIIGHVDPTPASYTWTVVGAPETTILAGPDLISASLTATFTFTDTAVNWIGVRCNVCGIAAVSIDGGLPTTVNTFGPAAMGSLTSEVVFSASGFAPGVTHTMVITVTGTTTSPALFGGALIAVDAFDVTR